MPASSAASPRSTLAFWLVAYTLFIANAGGNMMSPLYESYRLEWHFQPSTLTVIYAIYALVLIPGLPLFGVLSSRVSTRTMLISALGFVGLGTWLALFAEDVLWLGAARIAQGLGIAMMSGVGTKTLVSLVAPAEHEKASLAATVALAGGGGFGVLLSGALAEISTEPLRVPFITHGLLMVPALVGVLFMALDARQAAPGLQAIPGSSPVAAQQQRSSPLFACSAGALSFAVLGMFLSLAPTIVSSHLSSHSPLVGALLAFTMLASSTTAQLALRDLARGSKMSWGLVLLPMGTVAFMLFSNIGALVPIFGAIVAGGIGHGLVFLSGLEAIDEMSSPDNRAKLASIYLAACYAGASIPVIALGVIGNHLGVTRAAFGYAGLVFLIALPLLWKAVSESRASGSAAGGSAEAS